MLGAVVRLLFFALIVNPNFMAILKRRRGRVARSATPERSGGSPAEAENRHKISPNGGQAAACCSFLHSSGVLLSSDACNRSLL